MDTYRDEYVALRATIRARGTVRMVLLPLVEPEGGWDRVRLARAAARRIRDEDVARFSALKDDVSRSKRLVS